MKKNFTIAIFLCLSLFGTAHAQKMYVWCPKEQSIDARSGALSGIKIHLIVTDDRTFGKKVRNKCTSGELISDITSVVRRAYPAADVVTIASDQAGTEKNAVTIQIKVMAYAANFTTAMWHATTEYAVKITDNRTGTPSEKSRDIVKERSFFNLNGFSTAKHNLWKTYWEANADLTDFISGTLNAR